mmetsp:Transcript_61436/g.150366  ORF Transcript_61436/g.150366 Transcript_61436/m.150366 type:complete len:371 (-) Transcript_61436:1383-2495(-)
MMMFYIALVVAFPSVWGFLPTNDFSRTDRNGGLFFGYDKTVLHSSAVPSTDASTIRVVHDLQSELNAEGLGLCHGMLHASGVRRLSDLESLTPDQLARMGFDNFDTRELARVMDKLTSCDRGEHQQGRELSALVDGAFDRPTIGRFDLTPQQDFEMQVICPQNDIFKGRIFTVEQCEQLSRMSEYHAYAKTVATNTIGAGWTNAIYTLTAQHMPCKDVPGMLPTTKHIFDQLKRAMYPLFNGRIIPTSIQFESDSEPHLVKYDRKAKGTEMHTDSSEHISITLNVALSDDNDFTGGGTYIEAIDETVLLKQGEMLIHLGDLEHAGRDIHSGVRRLLICFFACEWEDAKLNNPNLAMSREALTANHVLCRE